MIDEIKKHPKYVAFNLHQEDFDYLESVSQELEKDHSVINLSTILGQLPKERTDLAEIICAMVFQDTLKQSEQTDSTLHSTVKSKAAAAEITNAFSEETPKKMHQDLLDIDYLRSNHPAFMKLQINQGEWDYLDKIKWSFVEDPGMYNLKKVI